MKESNDNEMLLLIDEETNKLAEKMEKIYIDILFSNKEDKSNCFFSVNSGSGGLEAEDWARMLWEMYQKYLTNAGYGILILDENYGEDRGLKSGTMKVVSKEKEYPYGWLKGETGVHRLVRISPYDKDKQRHTSFCSVYIIPESSQSLDIAIDEKDLKIDTYKASGAGGQHVNKTESAIRIMHIPSGIIVQCQNDRSQHRNRDEAMKMLKSKLYEQRLRKQKEENLAKGGEKKEISWGSQIRSYVAHPYQMVKDHRTNFEIANFDKVVIEGEIEGFLIAYLKSEI